MTRRRAGAAASRGTWGLVCALNVGLGAEIAAAQDDTAPEPEAPKKKSRGKRIVKKKAARK